MLAGPDASEGAGLAVVYDAKTLRREVDALDERCNALAGRLYDLDEDQGVRLLTETGHWSGESAAIADSAQHDLGLVWGAWATARDVVDRASTQLAAADPNSAQTTVAAEHDRGDGTRLALAALLSWLEAALDGVTTTGARLIDAWTEDLEAIDALRRRWSVLDERASTAGLSASTLVTAAKGELERYGAQIASDPIGASQGAATAAFDAAEAEVSTALGQRDQLAGRVARAQTLVADLRRLVPEGAELLAEARGKIAKPTGLLTPLDARILDAEPLGLDPWLRRIEAAAITRWRSAVAGLDRWEQVAHVHAENARAVVAANGAAIAKRNELRGLLEALRAKAGASGLAEDPAAEQLHGDARTLLHVAPCPLSEAARRVDAYRQHIVESTGA